MYMCKTTLFLSLSCVRLFYFFARWYARCFLRTNNIEGRNFRRAGCATRQSETQLICSWIIALPRPPRPGRERERVASSRLYSLVLVRHERITQLRKLGGRMTEKNTDSHVDVIKGKKNQKCILFFLILFKSQRILAEGGKFFCN